MPRFTNDRPVDLILQAGQFVPEFRTSAGIKRAHDLAVAAGGGYVVLEPGATYIWNTAVTWEASIVGLRGNNAILNNSSQSGSSVYSLTLTSTKGDYPSVMSFSDFSFIGDSVTGRDSLQTAIRCHTVTANSDVRVMLQNVRVQYQNTALSIGSGAFLTRGYGLELSRSKFGIQQESGASNFAEDCAFWGCTIFDNDCHIKYGAGQRMAFYGTSFDYFGSKDGVRQTSDDAAFVLAGGSRLHLFGCHVEWNYGLYSGQTNNPIQLTATGDMFFMDGGTLFYAGAGNAPFYSATIKSSQNFQRMRLRNVGMKGLGRTSTTVDDALMIGSETTNQAGSGGLCSMEDCYSPNNTFADLPSVVSYRAQSQWLRNGVDNPYLELSYKLSATDATKITNVTTDGSVNPRNSVGNFMKIATGVGTIRIPVPIIAGSQKLYPWALFINALNATGTVTIKENYTTYALKADGTIAADTRGAAVSSTTKTITGVGSNSWIRYSWKDVRGDTNNNPRLTYNAFFFIEIDCTGLSAGSIDLDDIAWTAG